MRGHTKYFLQEQFDQDLRCCCNISVLFIIFSFLWVGREWYKCRWVGGGGEGKRQYPQYGKPQI